ncbi:MAG: endonuclease MutS2 [Candidatus Coproplasma sp.]
MDEKSLQRLELNKILSACAEYACLDGAKEILTSFTPTGNLEDARELLARTAECDKLLYRYGVGKIEYFPDVSDLFIRASKRSTLSCAELLQVNMLLRSARLAYTSISGVDDGEIVLMRSDISKVYYDKLLEDDIATKILSSEEVSDYASDALWTIRSRIKSLNERIRSKLSEYLSGKEAQYLQDGIVTMRNDRYVIPVKAEHKSHVKGFIHDRSQSGATFFIEPEYVLELNNELISLQIDEKEEVERILKSLSLRVGDMAEKLTAAMAILADVDSFYARAEYSYVHKCTLPQLNKRGYINIMKGRHPLIDKDKVVPVSIELGKDYNFLLISGANTGGKTVTLKMCGLFCLMAECGLFIPAASGSAVCAFDDVFCDVGDSQSIEESLSTFSSHITSVKEILEKANSSSLVLIDELGGGTNPDEGQALAKAVVERLLSLGCRGIVTTHFTPLKEFAYAVDGIENASMEFDSSTLKPLYRIKIGLPGASNALAISRRLGLDSDILDKAVSYLSEGGKAFENIVRKAEESRVEAQRKLDEVAALELEWKHKLKEVNSKIDALNKEREKLNAGARAESRRIVNERTAQAEEILDELEKLFAREELTQTDLIKARTLKNKLKDSAYGEEQIDVTVTNYKPATAENLTVGAKVFVKPMQSEGTVLSLNPVKGECEVACGSMRLRSKFSELQLICAPKPSKKSEVKVVRSKNVAPSAPALEINVLGMTVEEALYEVENFIDRAVMDNLEQVKIIHGVGTGKLRAAISQRLKTHKNVKEYRLGKYGEGETGVTIVTLK